MITNLLLKRLLFLWVLAFSTSLFGQYSGTGTFNKIASLTNLTDGYYVVVNKGDAYAMNNSTTQVSNCLGYTAITPNSIVNPDKGLVWKIETSGSERTIYNESVSKYISYTGTSNNVQLVDAVVGNNQKWTFTYSSEEFVIQNKQLTGRSLQFNNNSGQYRFACYTGSQQNVLLYKLTTPTCSTSVFSFNSSTVNKVTGDASFTNTFTTNNTSPTAYSSTNTGVATVNASSGEVTINGAGTTTISVTQIADGTHCAVSSSYTLNVSSSTPLLNITGIANNGTVCTNSSGGGVTYTITNSGASAADEISVTSSDPQFVVSEISSTSIPANGTATFKVTFTPTSAGDKSSTITVTSTTAGSNTATYGLTGKGLNTPPTVTTPTSTAITASTATLGGNITIQGCSPITERGIYYSTTNNFAEGTGTKVSEEGSFTTGVFTVNASGLNSTTTYYYKAFATSESGTAYSTQGTFITTAIAAPVATAATDISETGFTANWGNIIDATGYELEVSKSPTFGTFTSGTFAESFEMETFPPAGWLNEGWARSTTSGDINTGNGAAVANSVTGTLTTSVIANPISMSFYLGRSSNSTAKTLDIQISTTSQTTGFTTFATFNHSNVGSGTYNQYNVDLSSYANSPVVYIRFIKTSTSTSPWRLDDVEISYGSSTPDLVDGYNPKVIAEGSTVTTAVEELNPDTQYYYRVRAKDANSTSVNSNVITATTTPVPAVIWDGSTWSNVVGPDATKDAIIADNYTAGSFSSRSLKVNEGVTLTVPSNGFVEIGKVTNEGHIVVANNANFVQSGDFTPVGTSTFELQRISKEVVRYDYISWSSPMFNSGQTLQAFSLDTNDQRFYTYNNGTYVKVNTPAVDTFIPGQGYQIRVPNNFNDAGQFFNGVFTGNQPNSGPITYDASGITSPSPTESYVFLGNPYPGALDMQKFYETNPLITGVFYIWDSGNKMSDNQYSGSNYFTYNAAGVVPAGIQNGFVSAGQGFFVDRGANVINGFTFNDEMRTTTETGTFAKTGVTDKFWLQMTTPSGSKPQMLIAFDSNASAGFDAGFDAKMFDSNADVIYSTVEGKSLIIDAHGTFTNTDVVNVTANFLAGGNYTIGIAQKEGVFANTQQIYLKDNLTGTETELTAGDYTFAATAGLQADRFTVSFNKGVLASSNTTKGQSTVYASDQIVYVNASSKIASVQVYDMSGKLIKKSSVSNSQNTSFPVSYKGITVVKLVLENGEIVTKKIIFK